MTRKITPTTSIHAQAPKSKPAADTPQITHGSSASVLTEEMHLTRASPETEPLGTPSARDPSCPLPQRLLRRVNLEYVSQNAAMEK